MVLGPRIGIGSGRALKVLVCYILYYLLLHHMLHLQMQKVSLVRAAEALAAPEHHEHFQEHRGAPLRLTLALLAAVVPVAARVRNK